MDPEKDASNEFDWTRRTNEGNREKSIINRYQKKKMTDDWGNTLRHGHKVHSSIIEKLVEVKYSRKSSGMKYVL